MSPLTSFPRLYLTGRTPELSGPALLFGLISCEILLVAVFFLDRALRARRRRGADPSWRTGALRLGLVAAFFLAWEGMLRVYVAWYPYQVYVPDPYRAWAMNPVLEKARVDYGINGFDGVPHGILDLRAWVEKPPGMWRILFLGDSQLLSTRTGSTVMEQTYPKVLMRRLFSSHVDTVNLGISGYSSLQGRILLRQIGVRYHPDLVVMAFGYHDSHPAFETDRRAMTDRPWLAEVRTALYASQVYLLLHRAVIGCLGETRAGPQNARRVPVPDYVRNLEAAAALARAHGARVAYLLEPIRADAANTIRETAPYRSAARQVAAREGALVLDAFTAFQRLPRPENLGLFTDEIHLNVAGHEMMAQVIEGILKWARAIPPENGDRHQVSQKGEGRKRATGSTRGQAARSSTKMAMALP